MIRGYDRASILAAAEANAAVQFRAEQMFRETLAAQIRHGLIRPGDRLNTTALRREFDDCKVAATYALDWERAHPGQQWMPAFTDLNRGEGLGESRYKQYTAPSNKDF
jgi:hypothetical protein